jgi:tetratricopeptide (TPR) repeat protein
MTISRLDQLLTFLKEEPDDPFILYAIATEYLKIDEKTAWTYFEKLLRHHENYPGTYYHAGKLQEKTGNTEEAIRIFTKGIEICSKAGKRHAVLELKNALQMLSEE